MAYRRTQLGFEPLGLHPIAVNPTDLSRPADALYGEGALKTTTLLRRPKSVAAIAMAAFALLALVFLTGCTAEVDAEMQTYAGINAIRTRAGLPPLQPSAELVYAARERSNDMGRTGHFAHDRIGGCANEFVCVLDRMRVPYAYAGENIAWNNYKWDESAARAITAWKNSPPHLENIMNCHYTKFGTGVAKSPDGKVWYTMIFEGNAPC